MGFLVFNLSPHMTAGAMNRLRTMFTDEDDTPAKCKERRLRRIQMRRLGAASMAADVAPLYGIMSVAGRLREMEDAVTVKTNFCRPQINRLRPLHFFGVFDGHGGSHVAALCKERMHVIMEEELMRVSMRVGRESDSESESEEGWKAAIKRCFERMDEEAMNTRACWNVGFTCDFHHKGQPLIGSTAVVALVTAQYIIVANCGDSRAVLRRHGIAMPLSVDHKPEREDEHARIQTSGGTVIFANGALRVEGILAMSRAIGDKFLKPIVISEPEISFTRRDVEDECLVLASDGIWDVLSNDLVCKVAHECLLERDDAVGRTTDTDEVRGPMYPSRSASAAALLTRLALGRKSADNVSVIVVDFKN